MPSCHFFVSEKFETFSSKCWTLDLPPKPTQSAILDSQLIDFQSAESAATPIGPRFGKKQRPHHQSDGAASHQRQQLCDGYQTAQLHDVTINYRTLSDFCYWYNGQPIKKGTPGKGVIRITLVFESFLYGSFGVKRVKNPNRYSLLAAANRSFTSLMIRLICWLVFSNSFSCWFRFSRNSGLSSRQSVNSSGCSFPITMVLAAFPCPGMSNSLTLTL